MLQPKDKARAGQIGVAVTVLRDDPLGRLNGAYRVPFENRKKRAFDYVAVLPGGDLVLALYDEASDQFRLDRIPMPYVTSAKKSIIPGECAECDRAGRFRNGDRSALPPAISPGRRRSPTRSRAARQRA